jgi:hypothetical protein
LKIKLAVLAVAGVFLSACRPPTTGVSITGYNHMQRTPIYRFTVDGAMGPNVDAESGGKESCCVAIPEKWRPGLKVKVSWEYDTYQDDPNPVLPSQTVLAEVPDYRQPSVLQVHFYADHKIKIVVSPCSPRHAFYPLSKEDLLPWSSRTTEEKTSAAAKKKGQSDEC